jgi:hypothetical protein
MPLRLAWLSWSQRKLWRDWESRHMFWRDTWSCTSQARQDGMIGSIPGAAPAVLGLLDLSGTDLHNKHTSLWHQYELITSQYTQQTHKSKHLINKVSVALVCNIHNDANPQTNKFTTFISTQTNKYIAKSINGCVHHLLPLRPLVYHDVTTLDGRIPPLASVRTWCCLLSHRRCVLELGTPNLILPMGQSKQLRPFK